MVESQINQTTNDPKTIVDTKSILDQTNESSLTTSSIASNINTTDDSNKVENQTQDLTNTVILSDKKQPAQPQIFKKKVPMKNVKVIQSKANVDQLILDINQSLLLQSLTTHQSELPRQNEAPKNDANTLSKNSQRGKLV